MEQVAFSCAGRAMEKNRPLEGMQATAQEEEGITVSSPGDKFFKARGILSGRRQGRGRQNVPAFKGTMPGPGIRDGDIVEVLPDGMFQSLSSGFTEPAEIELVGKADRKSMVRGKGEGKRGKPPFVLLRIKEGFERVFYLHSIGNKGRSLPRREGWEAPFAGI